jgi:hypothetical protein
LKLFGRIEKQYDQEALRNIKSTDSM